MAGSNRFADLGGLADRSTTLGVAVFVGGVSLVGVPPLTGFFGKFLLFDAAVGQAGTVPSTVAVGVLGVLLAGSILTIVYVTRVWTACFWGQQSPAVAESVADRGQLAVLLTLAAAIVVLGVGFEPVAVFADQAAQAALDTEGYVEAVDPIQTRGDVS